MSWTNQNQVLKYSSTQRCCVIIGSMHSMNGYEQSLHKRSLQELWQVWQDPELYKTSCGAAQALTSYCSYGGVLESDTRERTVLFMHLLMEVKMAYGKYVFEQEQVKPPKAPVERRRSGLNKVLPWAEPGPRLRSKGGTSWTAPKCEMYFMCFMIIIKRL